MSTFNPNEFVFDEFWKNIPKEGKQILTEISEQLSYPFFTGGKWKTKQKQWGGKAFWDYISVFGMGTEEQQAFRKNVDTFTGGNLKTISRVSTQGLGDKKLKIAFCFSAYIQQYFRNTTISAFIIGFRDYAQKCSSHIDFRELDDAFKKLVEIKSNQPPSIFESESKKSEILNRLIEIPLNEDSEEGKTSLSPKDHRSFPLRGRDEELERLDSLLSDDTPYKLQFIIAPSGAGKTRLVTEWFRTRPILKQWQAGFATKDDLLEQWQEWVSQELTCDTLIVIDYIYRFKEVVRAITDKGIAYHQRINETCKDDTGSENNAPKSPRLRLVILEHVLPDNAEYQNLPHYLKEALGATSSTANLKLRNDVKVPDISLSYTDDEQHKKLLKPIISDASGFSAESEEVTKAYETLEKMDKTTNGDDSASSRVFSRFPLFAILIGQALKGNPIDKIQHWRRSELIEQYFTDNRLPWKDGSVNGHWTGALVSVATLLQGLDYELMFSILASCQINFTEKDLKGNCVSIVSSGDSMTLKKYEPDILGETFTLLFLQEYRRGFSEKIDGKNINVKEVFFRLLCNASPDDNDKPTVNNRFIETIQRMALNLSNENQENDYIQEAWQTLKVLLAPDNYSTKTMKLSALIASTEVLNTVRSEQQIPTNRYVLSFLKNCDSKFLKKSFEQVNLSKTVKQEIGSVWGKCLFALSVLMDVSLVLNIMSDELKMVFDDICYEYENCSTNNRTRIFIPAFYNAPNLMDWMISEYPDCDVNTQDGLSLTILILAIMLGYSRLAIKILTLPDIKFNDKGFGGSTALMFACRCEQPEVAMALIDNKAALDTQNDKGWTALMIACDYKQTEVAIALIKNKAALNAQNDENWTALMIACEKKMQEVAMALIKNKAALNAQSDENWTALMIACCYNQPEVAMALIDNKATLDAQNDNKMTALMFACRCDQPKVAITLIDNKAALDTQNDKGWTALMLACRYDQPEVAMALINNKAALDAQNDENWTALMLACCYNQPEVAMALINNKAALDTQNDENWTALMFACRCDQPEVAMALINNKAALDTQNDENWTALMYACRYDQPEVAMALIDNKAALDAQNENDENWTALMLACCNNQPEVAMALIAKDAEINNSNSMGQTPLMFAAFNNYIDVVQALLKRGADINATMTLKGQTLTALELAKAGRHYEIIELLEAEGALELPPREK